MQCVLMGYGYWGKIVERYLHASKQFELYAICDPNFANTISLEEILNNDVIECVFVCTPVVSHFEIVKKLLQNGIHVFCEKPLCRDYKEMMTLIELSRINEVALFTDYIYTVSPSLQYIKQHIFDLGKIMYIDMSIKQFGNFYKADNVFEVIGVHMISALVFLLNTSKEEIQINSLEDIKYNLKGLLMEGIAFFQVNQIKGKIECSLLSDKKERRIEITCEKGIIIFDMLNEFSVRIISHKEESDYFTQYILHQEKYDESNNLKFILKSFYNSINMQDESNTKLTIQVTDILNQVNKFLK